MRVNAAANTWHRVSAVFDRASFSDGSYPCRFDYNNDGGANITIWFTSCLLVDLTAAFGAGLEPSKEWLDKHITAFGRTDGAVRRKFGGTVYEHRRRDPRKKRPDWRDHGLRLADRIRAL